MTARPRALIAWSSGKDSAFALHEVRRAGSFDVVAALTTVNETFSRISMHGVREELLKAQLSAAGLESVTVRVPFPCSNDIYESAMKEALLAAKGRGISHVIFGDLFLEDLRSYREKRLAEIGMQAAFPLWQRPTASLARDMLACGLQARLVSVDLAKLPQDFAGRSFDHQLLASLPPMSMRAARTASFIPLSRPARCSRMTLKRALARQWSATDLLMPISSLFSG